MGRYGIAWTVLALLATVGAGRLEASQPGDRLRKLDEIRQRLRAEAGVGESSVQDRDLPLVGVTTLPGDTHARLARELTGQPEARRVLEKIEPVLRPGRRLYIPRALLAPGLADARAVSFQLGGRYPTLWRLVREATATAARRLPVVVRNLQRLNGVVDPTRLPKGARILVPQSLLRAAPGREAPLTLQRRYRVADLTGLDRVARAERFPSELRARLEKAGQWARQLGPREVDLVVIHTTEHRGAPFDNVAQYLQRNRLANYLVGPDGTVYEIVPEAYRAHGCGQSLWEGRYEVDYGAVNVEIYADTAPGPHRRGIGRRQYEGLRRLLRALQTRHPGIHPGRVVTHRMVAVSYTYGTRSRKGDPYVFDWGLAGLPDNSELIDQDVLLGRAKLCTDERYADRVTEGQSAAVRMLHTL
ncbi:MAG: hypothetical protein Kow0092_34160 [Deferrisomatales bacterium]